jgi:hypothetical protein
MKSFTYFLTLFCVIAFGSLAFAQNVPIDFETGGNGAAWTWTVFENDTNPPVQIIPNPDISGANTSATVAQFTALQTGNPWAGTECAHGDIGTFTLDSTNSTVKIMVWKPVISDVGIKFIQPDGGALPEIKVPNTLINQWEELTFDFSGRIGHPATIGQDQIAIFPDFDLNGRGQTNVCYFDNVTFSEILPVPAPTMAAPDPIHTNEFSIYSDAYTNLANTNFNPAWGQSTVVTEELVEGNNTLKYSTLNYQGTNLGSSDGTDQDVSGYTHLHVDFWTPNATALNFFLISRTTGERSYPLPITTEQWVSVDIPLSHYTGLGLSLTDIFQFKVDGGDGATTIVWFDNWYFHSGDLSSVNEVSGNVPSAYALEQNYPNPFNPSTKIRFSLPKANHVTLKVYDMLGQEVATLVDNFKNAGTYEVNFDAKNLPTGTYFYSISAGSFNSIQKMLLIK